MTAYPIKLTLNKHLSKSESIFCIVAGCVNWVGILTMMILVGYPFFTTFPQVFSSFGCMLILMCGLFYICYGILNIASYEVLVAFFAIKFLYFCSWLNLMLTQWGSVKVILSDNFMHGLFFLAYGPVDIAVGIGFLCIFFKRMNFSETATY